MKEDFNYCHIAERTDVGCVRKANEDSMVHFECDNGFVAAVCDGMGGHVGGAVASQTAVAAIKEFLTSKFFDNPFNAIIAAIDCANKAILQKAAANPELSGMGSTCVMVIVRDGRVYYGSVGDSRIYLVRTHNITQLTKDQSYVQSLVDAGKITKEQAEHHPQKNVILNALGIADMKPATVASTAIAPEAGDCFVLCSDGLSGMVPDRDICKIVSKQQTLKASARANELVELAKQNGGSDNITVQIVEFSVTPKSSTTTENGNEKQPFYKNKYVLGGLAAVVVLAIVGLVFLSGGKSDKTEANVVDSVLENLVESENIEKDGLNIQTITLGEVKFEKGKAFLKVYFSTSGLTIKDGNGKHQLYSSNGSFGTELGKDVKINPDDAVSYSLNDTKTIATVSFKNNFDQAQKNIAIEFTNDTEKLVINIPVGIEAKLPTENVSEKVRGAKPVAKDDKKSTEKVEKGNTTPKSESPKTDKKGSEEKTDTAGKKGNPTTVNKA